MKSVVVDPRLYNWEGDRPLEGVSSRTIDYEMHVRGFTRHPNSGVGEQIRRHIPRSDRKDPIPATAWRNSRRIAAGIPVRPPGLSARKGQLLGLRSRSRSSRPIRRIALVKTRSVHSTSFATWSRRCTGPASKSFSDVVFNHTAEGAQSGPTLSFKGPRQQRLLRSGARPISLRQLRRHREYAQCKSSHRAPHDCGQSAVLGRGNAHRRISLRSRVHPRA